MVSLDRTVDICNVGHAINPPAKTQNTRNEILKFYIMEQSTLYVCKSTYFEHLQLAGHGGTYTYNSDPYHYRVRRRATGELIVEPGFRTRTLKKSEVRCHCTHACFVY